MTSPEGGFYSTQDADSEGEEGKFYVWTPAEIIDALGPEDGRLFSLLYDVTAKGNFEGKNILHLERSQETFAAASGIAPEKLQKLVDDARKKLYEVRDTRVHPGRDEKILVTWNGLMLRAFAEAASILGREDYRQAAVRSAEFVTSRLLREEEGESRLFRTFKDGRTHIEAFAEDYADYANGLISLYEATFDPQWVKIAKSLVETLTGHFWDEAGGFFSTSDFHESLVARPKELYDNAVPSGNSEAAEALMRLYLLTAEFDYERYALATMQPLLDVLGRAPTAFGRMLSVLDLYLSSPSEVALIGRLENDDMAAMLRAVWKPYIPNKVVAAGAEGDEEAARIVPLLADRPQVRERATAYVCRNYICEAPTIDSTEVVRLLVGGSGGTEV
jgi:uncharacterized protein YyaL (SSP411 family)